VGQYFLLSQPLSPAILDNLHEHSLQSLAINGAVGVQVEPAGAAGIDFTLSLTAVALDGGVVHRADYEAVFKAAVSAARRVSRR
jgi:fructose-specific phosphotransferase system component IIB